MRHLIKISTLACLLVFTNIAQAKLILVTHQEGSFIDVLNASGISFTKSENLDQALQIAKVGDGLLLLGSQARNTPMEILPAQRTKIKQKQLKVYLEFPYYIDNHVPQIEKINLERAVVNTDQIPGMTNMSIFTLNDQHYYRYANRNSLIAIAKIAGFDYAEYGLENTAVYPGLFQQGDFLISSVGLSNFLEARFGPNQLLNNLWLYILDFLGEEDISSLSLLSSVHPKFQAEKKVQQQDYLNAISAGTQWYYNSGLLIHKNWEHFVQQYTKKNGEGVVYPATPEQSLAGDGSLGILEGHASYIQADGSQPLRWWIRGDCQAETAFALSTAGNMLNQEKFSQTAKNLLDYLYKHSNLRAGERNDPNSTSFGLIGWATTDPDAYYGDDNARVILSTIGATGQLKTKDYFPYIIEGILGNFRTAGSLGFRGPWFRDAKLQTLNWKELYDQPTINYHPHYESWLWANYLWLYDKTGYEPLKTRAKKAIQMTMEAYPNWKWTNGIQQEYARMLLPLAWLVRVEDNELHRYWLKMVANTLLQDLDQSGAIKEKLGIPGLGRYDKVESNAAYGLKEAPLMANYGDKVTDLLYTLNYAAFGLNEAYGATQDSSYQASLNKINDFFVKIQVQSEAHKDLDGAWLRAFDFGRWDYWASNADSGWGPWGTQTGWTQSWVLNSLAASVQKENFWQQSSYLKQDENFKKLFEKRKKSMLN